jgi:hypothetical protein
VISCPRCHSDRLRRSHARWWQRPRRWLTREVVYKCGKCHHRVWVAHDKQKLPLIGVSGRVAGAGVVVVLALALALGGWWALSGRQPARQGALGIDSHRTPAARRSDGNERLALLSARTYGGAIGDFRFVEGEVRNMTGDRFDHVEAVCTWFDERGRVVSVESSPVVEAPLLPGQTSAFKTMTKNRPDLTRFALLFRNVDGALLATFDQADATDTIGTSGNDPSTSR